MMTRRQRNRLLRGPPRRRRWAIRLLIWAPLLVATWFAAVHLCWFEESCDDCLFARSVFEIQVFGLVVYSWSDERVSFIQLAGESLGVPCGHPHYARWHKHRWWGLYICAYPCHNGTYAMIGEQCHWPRLLEELRRMAADDPTLPNEFYQRIFIEHDYEYGKDLMAEVKGRLAAAGALECVG